MKKYAQLTQEQRYHIAALKKTGLSVTMIAEQVGTHKSTISRELRRNLGGRGYSPKQAQELSDARRSTARKYIKMTLALRKKIEALLRKDWSPDQISEKSGGQILNFKISSSILEISCLRIKSISILHLISLKI